MTLEVKRNTRGQATYRIRNIRMMTSPLLISFSDRFSFLRSLIVPRLRWLYTLFAFFFIVPDERRLCDIMRTHSSMSASLD